MSELIGLVVRHALTALGADGIFNGDETEKVVGALAVLAGVAWSVFNKTALREKLKALLKRSPQ